MKFEIVKNIWATEYVPLLGDYFPNEKNICIGCKDVDGTLAGLSIVEIMGKTANLNYLFVQKEYRQKGIGKALFELSKKLAKKGGAHIFRGDFDAKKEMSDALLSFFYAMGCETRLERIPTYRATMEEVEKEMERKKITKMPKVEIQSFREMPEGLMSRFVKEQEEKGNYFISRYNYMLADPDRSFYYQKDHAVKQIMMINPGEDGVHVEMDVLWSKSGMEITLFEFCVAAMKKLKEAPVVTESIEVKCVSPKAILLADYVFDQSQKEYHENITWWIKIA